jgi:hypothetical protein
MQQFREKSKSIRIKFAEKELEKFLNPIKIGVRGS